MGSSSCIEISFFLIAPPEDNDTRQANPRIYLHQTRNLLQSVGIVWEDVHHTYFKFHFSIVMFQLICILYATLGIS